MPTVPKSLRSRPPGLRWRASSWFITLVVGMGITTDFLVYSIIIPVMPFHLHALHYSGVSALVGYLLFAYSGGLALSTPIVAWHSEQQSSRKPSLMFGLLALACSQVLLMESREYWVMAIARVCQGVSASVVWTAGLALICDTVPEKEIGRYLGLAMCGLPLGQLVGPPVGGALFDRFGIRGPCLLGIAVIGLDMIGRLLLIERREALVWGFDPAAAKVGPYSELPDECGQVASNYGTFNTGTGATVPACEGQDAVSPEAANFPFGSSMSPRCDADGSIAPPYHRVPISFLDVLKGLSKSSRARAAVVNSFVYGILYSCQEPTLPVYLRRVWGLDSSQVGLVFIAAALPAVVSSPVSGWLADKKGTEWVTFICLLLAVPCWIAVIIPSTLPSFIVAFAFENLCTAAFVAPVTTELALVARGIPGVGYAHVYGAFNFAVGIGASVGPVIGGEIFKRSSQGWTILNLLAVAVIVLAIVVVATWTGERPLVKRLRRDSPMSCKLTRST
ncbi:MFS general substrate transporter [Gloeopeniophorella convolvens]|nr:MFS general substrate transporter [Gloeopeniophorella convolvens]